MNQRCVFTAVPICLLAAVATICAGSSQGGMITKEVEIAAPSADVWKAWTTEEGVKSFFAPGANIDLTLGGHYEIFFSPDQPYGFRGADHSKVHDIVPGELLAFTWNAPSDFGVLRNLHTLVFVRLEEPEPGRTRVTLNHIGFGESPQWLKLHEYFSKAWGVILVRLRYRFEHGPVDWSSPPAVTTTLTND